MDTTLAKIEELHKQFSSYVIRKQIVSENRQQFPSKESNISCKKMKLNI